MQTYQSRLLTKKETAERLKVSERTIDRYVQSQLLRAIRLSARTVRFREDEVERLLA